MRTIFGFMALGVTVLAVAAQSGSKALADYVGAISAANTLHARYSVQAVGGAPVYYTVDLQKPNKVRVDSTTKTIVADGTTITQLDKANNIYSKRPQTDAELARMFNGDDLYLWTGFFDAKGAQVFLAKDRGTTTLSGQTMNIVEAAIDKNGRRAMTFYMSPGDKLVRQAQVIVETPAGKATSVLAAREISVGSTLTSDTFAYANTSGAKEVSWDDMQPLRWLTDINDGIAAAADAKKKILIDFYMPTSKEWQKLNDEVYTKQEFREFAKKVILVRIDASARRRNNNYNNRQNTTRITDPVQTYGVQQVPTEIVTDKDGAVIDSVVGYTGADAFNSFLKTALAD